MSSAARVSARAWTCSGSNIDPCRPRTTALCRRSPKSRCQPWNSRRLQRSSPGLRSRRAASAGRWKCRCGVPAANHAYHLAEHHATPLGMAPSPSVFLAAVAQRTTRLRFGPLVYTLNLYHPLRLIDEICMLDQMSGGRLELGVGQRLRSKHIGEELEREIKLVYVTGLPHNPTGAVLSDAELSAVARIAVEHDLLVPTSESHARRAFDAAVETAGLPVTAAP